MLSSSVTAAVGADSAPIASMGGRSMISRLTVQAIKCDLALAQAKKLYDKREKFKRREAEAEARAAIREGR